MTSTHDILRERLLQAKGLIPRKPSRFSPADLKQLMITEWSPEFERLMRNRLLMGALRYGTIEEKRNRKCKWDVLSPITQKIKLYVETGNTEYLVDAANYCMLVFELDDHPNKHFHALDDHHDHCKLKTTTTK